ncbi:MAG TPA: sugar ABC transporter permease [Actinocatenispora sp.]
MTVTTPVRTGRRRSAAGAPRPGRIGPRARRTLTGYAFLAGGVICFATFSWYPMVREIVLSLQRTRYGETSWAGFDNYVRVVHDPAFWQAWRNTAEFTGLALVLGFALPFLVAVVLNELRHAQGYLRALVYLPVMLPPASSLLLFKYAYDPGDGLFNQVLSTLHLPTSQWLQSTTMAMPSLVVASTWMNMGGAVLIYLAALQGIPGELYEAAELDGARLLGRFRHVTIPQCRLVLSLMLMLQVISTMQMFIEAFLLTNGSGPEGATTTVVYLIYQHAFNLDDLGGAAALGTILLLVLAGFSAAYVRLDRGGREQP